MKSAKIRAGVDIGGTFTDVVLEVHGQTYSTKVLTTYAAPEDAIISGLQQVCDKAGVDLGEIEQIVHGTTLATNALIERRGAKTALITTQGFRDVIEMRTESRFEQYDLNISMPEPLVPRQHRFTLNERIAASGDVLVSLEPSELSALIDQLEQGGFESIAVGFLHSYVNNSHERAVADAIAERLPNVMVSLSCEVSPQMREYERFNTTVANAYIKPLMKSYLSRLKGQLKTVGVTCDVFLVHSGGGIIALESAAEFPVRLVESGPAGGAVFAAHLAAQYGLDKVVSFDMGGTTAKICLINNQAPKTSRVFEVARTYRFKKGSGMPISIPVIDMVEIGAGGGSLGHLDAMRQIRVGPESAGSEPGPACYAQGGTRPAVTDADLILGKLDPDNFAGGTIVLNRSAAEQALEATFGDQLGMNAQNAAFGMAEVVDENMANAARVHAVENGEDLADYTMIAFGGAAPLHAARLCQKLGIDRLLVPQGAGVGSAIGFLRAPFSYEANRSDYMRLSRFDAERIKAILRDLEHEATEFVRACDAKSKIVTEYKVYMRYVGQGWEIPISITAKQAQTPDADTFLKLFEQDYSALFGRTVEGMDIEITVWSVNATTPQEPVTQVEQVTEQNAATSVGSRELFDQALSKTSTAQIIERSAMQAGEGVTGPALIVEDETTIVLPSNCAAVRQSDGCINISVLQRKTSGSNTH